MAESLGELMDALSGDADTLDNMALSMYQAFADNGELDYAVNYCEAARQQLAEAEALEAREKFDEAQAMRDAAGGTIETVKGHAQTAISIAGDCHSSAEAAHGRIAERTHTTNQHIAAHAVGACAVLKEEASAATGLIEKGVSELPDKTGRSEQMTPPMQSFWEAMSTGSVCIQHAQIAASGLREYVAMFSGGGSYGPGEKVPGS